MHTNAVDQVNVLVYNYPAQISLSGGELDDDLLGFEAKENIENHDSPSNHTPLSIN